MPRAIEKAIAWTLLVIVTGIFMVGLFACVNMLAAFASAQELTNVERPTPPSEIRPAPPQLCGVGDLKCPVSDTFACTDGFRPTCIETIDWWCWDMCGHAEVSFADIYARDGQPWHEHWKHCELGLPAWKARAEQGEAALADALRKCGKKCRGKSKE